MTNTSFSIAKWLDTPYRTDSYFIHGLAQMTQHMKFVIDDQRLASIAFFESRLAERLPHIHDRDADFSAIFWAKPGKESVEALLRTIFAAEPNGSAANQIADDDAIFMATPHRDLVDADGRRALDADTPELFTHVLFVQLLDSMPIEQQLLGKLADGGRSAASPYIVGESFGVQRIVRQPFEGFVLHGLAPQAIDTPSFVGQVDASVPAREVANLPRPFVVVVKLDFSTDAAHRFF
jgi:hypothetical protein